MIVTYNRNKMIQVGKLVSFIKLEHNEQYIKDKNAKKVTAHI